MSVEKYNRNKEQKQLCLKGTASSFIISMSAPDAEGLMFLKLMENAICNIVSHFLTPAYAVSELVNGVTE